MKTDPPPNNPQLPNNVFFDRRKKDRRVEDYQIKRLEQELLDANTQLETILLSIGGGMIVTDAKGKIIKVNYAAQEVLGYTISELLDKDYVAFIQMENKAGQKLSGENRLLSKVLKSGDKISSSTYYYIRKDGTRFPADIIVSPIVLNKKIIGAVNIFKDISREKEIDQAKTEFVSLASHQLRTPLSSIGWYTEMLLAGDAGNISEQQKEYLKYIYESNQRMAQLVNDLLNVSKIEMGIVGMEIEDVNVVEIANDVLKELEPQLYLKNIKLIKNYGAKPCKAGLDPRFTKIVLQNIIANAVKYTPEKGEITLSIECKKPEILIKVSDTGLGIPDTQKSQIFTKLFRADNIQNKEPDGTGLGLYIVKAFVEKSGGKVWFESQENKGTTFYVTLPLPPPSPHR